jgi:hypothetical protein
MSAARRLGAYGLVLVGLFASAYAVGELLPGHQHGVDASVHTHGSSTGDTMAGMSGGGSGLDTLALSSSVAGYRLVLDHHDATSLAFHLERDGRPVTRFTEQHDALLHLLLVRRDLTGFQHVHPTMASDGTWTAEVDLAEPGAWRVVADAWPTDTDAGIALGADVLVPGDAPVAELPPADDPANTMVSVDGLMFMRDGLHVTVSPTDGLAPYLGQPAHLVAFRQGDLAYTHLHPTGDTLGDLTFANALPGAGTYRLYLQVLHDGRVVTAEFTVAVDDTGAVS